VTPDDEYVRRNGSGKKQSEKEWLNKYKIKEETPQFSKTKQKPAVFVDAVVQKKLMTPGNNQKISATATAAASQIIYIIDYKPWRVGSLQRLSPDQRLRKFHGSLIL